MQHTILLCDDEPYIRNGLKKAIEHELPQFIVRYETDNGTDAVRLVQEHLPSVIITDIRMPKMSGIDFLESIHEDAPDLPIIIISGYPDIEVMRRAMHLGVREFLSKPIDTPLLFSALRKIDVELRVQQTAEARLLKKMNAESPDLNASRPAPDALPAFRTFQNWFQTQAERRYSEQRGDDFCYGCVLITSNCPFKWLQALIDQWAVSDCDLQIAPISHQRYGLFICTNRFDQHQFFMLIQKQLMRIRIFVQRNLSQAIRFFLSDLRSHPRDAFSCCENALITMNTTKFKSQIISNYNDLSSITPTWFSWPAPEICRDICRADASEAARRTAMDRLFESYDQLAHDHPDVMHDHMIALFFLSAGPKVNIHDLLAFTCRLKLKNSLAEKKDLLSEQIGLLNAVKHQTPQPEPTVSDRVKAYVSAHVQDVDLSINDVAAELFISPNYLRQLFKEETGQTFVQYLTAHRMVLAKKLLCTGKIRIAAAATQLGYQDAKYFSYCFKKYYKITPSEYIQSLHPI